jgi:Uma2 family endonuclease
MTPQEFDETPEWAWDDRYRYELIRGVLVVAPPAGNAEVDPNDELGHLLRKHQEEHALGSVIDLTLPEQTLPVGGDRRRCDRAIWTGLGRMPDPAKDTPTVVVEFVSAGKRDRKRDYEEKRAEYRALGVPEYWIIDRFRRVMTVYRSEPSGSASQTVTETQTYETDRLPGFCLPLARLLSLADRWKKSRPKRSRKPPAEGTETHG